MNWLERIRDISHIPAFKDRLVKLEDNNAKLTTENASLRDELSAARVETQSYREVADAARESAAQAQIPRALPHGAELFQDIKRLLPNFQAKVIFDVGANAGQSTEEFLKWFPESRIYCFEPVSSTFARLQATVTPFSNVECFQMAMGAAQGVGQMPLQGSPLMYTLKHIPEEPPIAEDTPIEDVKIETIAHFCQGAGIERISLLKIDTEGYDLEVLRGAANMLDEGSIDMLEVEAGMHPMNPRHVPLEELKKYFESKKYFLFGFYEQMYEWTTGEPHLRRANPIFISAHVREMNRR